jgi:glyoxylase-like metal-dependent hydrolase (beta-lactamase superfamily II)
MAASFARMTPTTSRRAVLCGCFACFVAALAKPIRAAEPKPGLALRELAKGTWLHTSWKTLPEVGHFPSNGLVIAGRDVTWLIDTAWEDEDTDALFDAAKKATGRAPARVLVSHAHDDRMSGLPILHARGVHSLAHAMTQEDAPGRDLTPAQESWSGSEQTLDIGGRKLQLLQPGAAHTRDNVVMFLPDAGLLFGGCMIRPAAGKNLGNVADASIAAWPATARTVQKQFGKARIVVPGHGDPGDTSLLTHTIALAEAAQSKVSK